MFVVIYKTAVGMEATVCEDLVEVRGVLSSYSGEIDMPIREMLDTERAVVHRLFNPVPTDEVLGANNTLTREFVLLVLNGKLRELLQEGGSDEEDNISSLHCCVANDMPITKVDKEYLRDLLRSRSTHDTQFLVQDAIKLYCE